MVDSEGTQRRWAMRLVPPEPRSIVQLLRDRTLDPELAAHLWLLVGAGVPVVVAAGPQHAGKTTLLNAVLDFLPGERHIVELAGEGETFGWLPQATELGWPGVARPAADHDPIRPATTVLYAHELSDHTPAYTWDAAARVFVRAASIGYQLAATIHADSLEDVFEMLRWPPVRLTDDELSHLGIVLILRRTTIGRRVVAAHYVRPIARDVHGHTQRLGPAVIATWDPRTDTFEHFGWGVTPELAQRVSVRPGDYEADVERRGDILRELVRSGPVETQAVRSALRSALADPVFDASEGRS
jgi:hypothetical protein